MIVAIPVVYSLILPKHLTPSITIHKLEYMVFVVLLKIGLFSTSVTDNKLLSIMQHPLNVM